MSSGSSSHQACRLLNPMSRPTQVARRPMRHLQFGPVLKYFALLSLSLGGRRPLACQRLLPGEPPAGFGAEAPSSPTAAHDSHSSSSPSPKSEWCTCHCWSLVLGLADRSSTCCTSPERRSQTRSCTQRLRPSDVVCASHPRASPSPSQHRPSGPVGESGAGGQSLSERISSAIVC